MNGIAFLALISATLAPQSDIKSHVKELNAETAAAYKTHDAKFFESLFSPDFKAKDEHGVLLARKQALFVVRFQLNSIRFTDYKATTKALKLEPAQATMLTQAKMVGIAPGRRGAPPSKVVITRQWSDLYKKRDGKWDLVFRTELAAPIVKSQPIALLKPASPGPGHPK